ncbi:hypothetical protein [Niastella populi]|uniref:Uncharacterized protein n=1 Tax=Niastella populi TaxID=550983 RepID=A0A1V9ESC7_9BACT|nr:hypothetical protein [Niastella populi]OQP49057.1 hypothetical protein A4R26_31070 [Niastella populi]
MTLEKLVARQEREIVDYFREREKRLTSLEDDQKELVSYCSFVNPKTHTLLKNLLQEQRSAWEAMEKDDLDMLKQIHALERENLLDKQAKRDELVALLSKGKDQAKDRGR